MRRLQTGFALGALVNLSFSILRRNFLLIALMAPWPTLLIAFMESISYPRHERIERRRLRLHQESHNEKVPHGGRRTFPPRRDDPLSASRSRDAHLAPRPHIRQCNRVCAVRVRRML